MATEWFVRRGEKTSGPFSSKQLKSLAKSGRLKTEDLIRKGLEGEFVPITRVQGLIEQPEEGEWSIENESPIGSPVSQTSQYVFRKVWLGLGACAVTLLTIMLVLLTNRSNQLHTTTDAVPSVNPLAPNGVPANKIPTVVSPKTPDSILAEMERNPPITVPAVMESEFKYDFTKDDYNTLPLGCTKKTIKKVNDGSGEIKGKPENQEGYVTSSGDFVAHGTFTTWFDSRETNKLREGMILHGKLHGIVKFYSPEGTLTGEHPWVQGERHGIRRSWTNKGTLTQEKGYLKGLPHGVHQQWYDDGKKESYESYDHGIEHGVVKRWWPDGQLFVIGCLNQGKRVGKRCSWEQDGSAGEWGEWEDDKPIGRCRLVFPSSGDGYYFVEADDKVWYGGTKEEFIAKMWYFNLRDSTRATRRQCSPESGVGELRVRSTIDFLILFGKPDTSNPDVEFAASLPQQDKDKCQIWSYRCSNGTINLRTRPIQRMGAIDQRTGAFEFDVLVQVWRN